MKFYVLDEKFRKIWNPENRKKPLYEGEDIIFIMSAEKGFYGIDWLNDVEGMTVLMGWRSNGSTFEDFTICEGYSREDAITSYFEHDQNYSLIGEDEIDKFFNEMDDSKLDIWWEAYEAVYGRGSYEELLADNASIEYEQKFRSYNSFI